jgi:very-short-patch-repair endonuclease
LALLPTDVFERPDGIRLTTAARTLFDMASVVSGLILESMLEQGLHEKLFTLDALHAIAGRLRQRGRPGSEAFGALLEARVAWQAPAESGLEVRFIQALRGAGFPEPVRQLPIVFPNGQRIRVDLAYPQWRIAMEVDGFGHSGPTASIRDQRRDRAMSVLGWITLRFGRNDLWPDVLPAVAVVRSHVDASRRAPGSKLERYTL